MARFKVWLIESATFDAKGRVGGAIELQRMHLPLREGKCGDVETAERLLASLVGDVLGRNLLPEPRENHLRRKGSAVLATGFSPKQYLREVTVVADHEGRPLPQRASVVVAACGRQELSCRGVPLD